MWQSNRESIKKKMGQSNISRLTASTDRFPTRLTSSTLKKALMLMAQHSSLVNAEKLRQNYFS